MIKFDIRLKNAKNIEKDIINLKRVIRKGVVQKGSRLQEIKRKGKIAKEQREKKLKEERLFFG